MTQEQATIKESRSTWKNSMLILVVLYPIAFLNATFFQRPLMMHTGIPFWFALFIGNSVSVVIFSYVLPLTFKKFNWWLQAKTSDATIKGICLVVLLCALWLFIAAHM